MFDLNAYLTKVADNIAIDKDRMLGIERSINYIDGKLWECFRERLLKVEVFGSFTRGTALSQKTPYPSDVDILVIFKQADRTPETLLKHLKDFADDQYSRSEVNPDHPAITIEMDHITFELVPTYVAKFWFESETLRIPAPRSKEVKWIDTDPNKLKDKLEVKNNKEGGLMVPLIRLIKYYNGRLGKPFDSYELETFAISRGYPKKELAHFLFEFAMDLKGANIVKTESQKNMVQELTKIRNNFIALQENAMYDYLALEAEKHFPLIP